MSLQFNPPPNWPAPPVGWVPPEGWQPDPSWGPAPDGWNFWVEASTYGPTGNHSAMQNSSAPLEGQPFGQTAPSVAARPKPKKWPWIVGIVVFVFIVGSCTNAMNGDTPSASSIPSATPSAVVDPAGSPESGEASISTKNSEPAPTTAPAPKPKPKPKPKPNLPQSESAFIDAVAKGATSYEDASTDLKGAKAIKDRDKKLCKVTGGVFTKWEGEITKIGANDDGHAYISVQIEDSIRLATWNNAFSDIGDETLIQEGTKLWEKLLDMEEGQRVSITGKLVPDEGSCVKTSNMTDVFGAIDPDFLARFTDVSVVK